MAVSFTIPHLDEKSANQNAQPVEAGPTNSVPENNIVQVLICRRGTVTIAFNGTLENFLQVQGQPDSSSSTDSKRIYHLWISTASATIKRLRIYLQLIKDDEQAVNQPQRYEFTKFIVNALRFLKYAVMKIFFH